MRRGLKISIECLICKKEIVIFNSNIEELKKINIKEKAKLHNYYPIDIKIEKDGEEVELRGFICEDCLKKLLK